MKDILSEQWKRAFQEWYDKYFAEDWRLYGFSPEEEEEWSAIGDPFEAKKWRDEGFSFSEAWAWKELNVPFEYAVEFRLLNITPIEVKQLKDLRLELDEILVWKNLGLDIRMIELLVKKGFTSEEVKNLLKRKRDRIAVLKKIGSIIF